MSDMKRLLAGAYMCGYSDARNDKAIDPIGAIERLTMNVNKGDLISKEDVLNCIKKLYAGHTACNMFEALDAVAEYIEELPSTEPKGIPIEWLEEKLTNHPELPYAVTDGIIEVLELWKTSCGTKMEGEEK